MSKKTNDIYGDNLVSFPRSVAELGQRNDPLEDLLNEFSEYSDHDFDLDADWEDPDMESHNSTGEINLKAMGLGQSKEQQSLELIGEQLCVLQEIRSRMRYYLDEVETYLPSAKK